MKKAKPWCSYEVKGGIKVKIDREDLARIEEHSWRVQSSVKGGKPRVVTSVKNKTGSYRTMTLGQFLLKPKKGNQVFPRRYQASLDYRKSNLIVCNMKERQIMLPKRKSKNATSIYKGVSFIKSKNTWRARIEHKGKQIYIGDFDSENKAALAYNRTAKMYYGDIAYTNPVNRKIIDRSK